MFKLKPHQTKPAWLIVFIILVLICSASVTIISADELIPLPEPTTNGTTEFTATSHYTELAAIASQQGTVRVIVALNMKNAANASNFYGLDRASQQPMIATAQQAILDNLTNAKSTPANVRQYSYIPFMAMTVDLNGLNTLAISPLILAVQADRLVAASLEESTVQIGAQGTSGTWASGWDGTNTVIAVLDTGVAKENPLLDGGKVVEEACYSTNGSFSDPDYGNYTSVSACKDGNPSAIGSNTGVYCIYDGCDHGSHVAGIAAGDGNYVDGVARDAKIMSVQVFSGVFGDICTAYGMTYGCALSFTSDQISGLERVYTVSATRNIVAVNLSLGGGKYKSEAECDADNAAMKAAVAALKEKNIAVIAAAGNNGWADALNAPACLSNVFSVGAVKDDDKVAGFSNNASFLDYLAPGVNIRSSIPDNNMAEYSGTSQAAPHVAGAWAILREYRPDATMGDIKNALKVSAVMLTADGRQYPRIQVNNALDYFNVPGVPALSTPTDTTTTSNLLPTFKWSKVEYAKEYKLKITDQTTGEAQKITVASSTCGGSNCSVTLTVPLIDGHSYLWNVEARNTVHKTKSAKFTLTIDHPGASTLSAPTNQAQVSNPAVTFKWGKVSAATSYRLDVTDVNSGKRVIKVVVESADVCGNSNCTYALPTDLQGNLKGGKTYEWRIQSRNDSGKSNSTKFTFTTTF